MKTGSISRKNLGKVILLAVAAAVLVASGWIAADLTIVAIAHHNHAAMAGPFSIYLQDSALLSDVLSLQTAIASSPDVENVTYVSKDEALKSAEKMWADYPELLASLEETNALPASLDVVVKDPDDDAAFRRLIDLVETYPAFEETVQRAQEPDWWLYYH